jgi:hypothetical protein
MLTDILDYIYGVLTSTKTTVVLFGFILVFFLVGNVLPYGGSYEQIKVTGFARTVIETFDLLNVYSGPWFLTTAGLFFLNLLLCTHKRTKWTLKIRRPAVLTPTTLAAHKNAIDLELPYSPEETTERVETFFRNRLFLQKPSTTRIDVHKGGVYEQGFIHYLWLSLAFHVAVLLAVIGSTITFLFSFESEMTIFPGTPVEVATVSADTLWNKRFGEGEGLVVSEDAKFSLGLKEFTVEYTQRPTIVDFPRRGIVPRIKNAWRLGGLKVVAKEDSYYPVGYASELVVYENGSPVKEARVEVNTPLRYRGLTIYQSAYEYKFDLYADGNKVEAGEDDIYTIPGLDGTLEPGYVITGKFYLRDGTEYVIEPFVKMTYTPPEPEEVEGEGEAEGDAATDAKEKAMPETFKLAEGKPMDIKGTSVRIDNVRAGTILSYRHDPGVSLLWIAVPIIFFAMLFRAWGRWCRASYIVEKRPGGSRLLVHLQVFGVWGGEEGMTEAIRRSMTS